MNTNTAHEQEPIDKALELLYDAWTLIANTGWDAHRGTFESGFSPGWHEAALRWRDRYFDFDRAATREG